MDENKKIIDDKKIEKVVGGEEPEEFGWRTNGYVTPVKDKPSNPDDFRFEIVNEKNKRHS